MVTTMLKDMVEFIFILAIFILSYGIGSTAILYPNEWRVNEIVYNVLFIPCFQIFGEVFLGERTTYR